MSNTEMDRAVVPAASVHSYAFNLHRLETEIRDDDPDAERVVELLGSLTGLQGIGRIGRIGDEAEHCLEYFVENKVDSPAELAGMEFTDGERREIHKRVTEWIDGFEHHLESAVAAAPTTEIPPNELLSGSQELLAEHVGERFEAEVRDLNEAANNLCAGSYTSAEFMCIRAVERLLRQFFRDEMDSDVRGKDWSQALDAVATGVSSADVPEELETLEYLKERRRELVHPEKHSTQAQAERTLMKTFRLVDALIESL